MGVSIGAWAPTCFNPRTSLAQPEGCGYAGAMAPLTLAIPPILLSACLTIYGELAHRREMVYVFKPLTTGLILLLAALPPAEGETRYRLAIVLGLCLSLLGDVFLMLPGDRFVAGLAAFLLAHLAYLAAFTMMVPFGAEPAALLLYAAAAAAILILAWPRLGPRMRIPVIAYAAVLGGMAGQALTVASLAPAPPATAAAFGAALFVLSDAALVVNRFVRPFRLSPLVVLGTYYTAQTLIAVSVAKVLP